jgi:hypothetical protein
MRLLIFIALIFAFDFYVFQAFKIVGQNWSAGLKNVVYTLYWLVPVATAGFIFLLAYGDPDAWNKNVLTIIRSFLIILYMSKFLVAAILVVDDLRRLSLVAYDNIAGSGSFDAGRSKFLSQFALILGAIPFFSLTYGILRNPYRYRVFREKIKLSKLPKALEGLKIIQISDIHSGSFTMKDPVKNAINLINEQKPDLVFFTGDLVNNVAAEMEPFVDVFDKIEAKHGVYSVLGNHDYGDYVRWNSIDDKRQNLENLKETHRKMGWQLLLNDNQMLNINDHQVAVIGVENYSAHPRFPKYGDLNKATEGTDNAHLKLLLSHDPSHWEDQVTQVFKDIAITFSGHTHGMQFGIEIPGWLKWSPIQYVYKQWAGLYQKNEQYLYVNRGLGFLGYPGRVGILPEITVIELETAEV